MLGAIIGDIVGSPYEFANIKTTDFRLLSEASHFTDDTVMTIAVGLGLRKGFGDPRQSREAIIDAMHEYGRRYPRAGYGGRFRRWLRQGRREPYGSYGNGSAMRVSAAGWLYDTLEDVTRYAAISAAVTHDHPEGIKGAQAVASAIWMARHGAARHDITEHIVATYGYDLSFTLDEIRPRYAFDVTCQGSVPQAIKAFLESVDFEDAVRKAVSIGGDSDTIAAIAGGIAEAYYKGIPQWIREAALERLDAPLRQGLATALGQPSGKQHCAAKERPCPFRP